MDITILGFFSKAKYYLSFILFNRSEESLAITGQQTPLGSTRFRFIEPRRWHDSSLYQKESLFSVLPLNNREINDDSSLTRGLNIYRLLRNFDVTYWKQYIVKVILLCWPCCTVFNKLETSKFTLFE